MLKNLKMLLVKSLKSRIMNIILDLFKVIKSLFSKFVIDEIVFLNKIKLNELSVYLKEVLIDNSNVKKRIITCRLILTILLFIFLLSTFLKGSHEYFFSIIIILTTFIGASFQLKELLSYFLKEVFISEQEKAEKLFDMYKIIRKIPNDKEAGRNLAKKILEMENLENLIEKEEERKKLVESYVLADNIVAEANNRFLNFTIFLIRIILTFTFSIISLVSWLPNAFENLSLIQSNSSLLQLTNEIVNLFNASLYFVLVTLVTVGYGDIHPNNLFSRILVEIIIITSLLFISFGLNLSIGLVIEGSSLVRNERLSEIFMNHIKKSYQNIKNVTQQ
jgi:hypothetical protein